MFGQDFWAVFLAVFLAMGLFRAIDAFSQAHRRWKRYCKAQAKEGAIQTLDEGVKILVGNDGRGRRGRLKAKGLAAR
jgi:hypothetical protein